MIEATCDAEGKTIHRCDGCGSSFVTDYTSPLGHSWDKGTLVTNATCTGEGIMEYRCTRGGYHRLDADPADGHIPGAPATCTEPRLCTRCGAVLEKALGHDYKSEVTAPTCTEMGYTTNTCSRCGDTNKSNCTEPTGHKPGDWIIDVRVLNLVNLEQSDGYNPFSYLRDEKDALKLVNTLIQATTPKGSHESDPFWTKSETALLQAIILMLHQEAPEYEQNFSMVMHVLEYAEVREDDDEYISPLDLLFKAMEHEHPESVALRQHKVFKQAAGKTAKSILVSAAVRLAPFNLPQIKAITDHDDMDLYTLGEKKCALYAVIPDNDTTFNFLVSLLYSQIFQALYSCADQIHHGALPCHVHFILDEAPSVNLPGLPRELATMRSRNISCSTIIQNMAQIKELYKDSWETIPGNSDTLLYLGGNESSTHKYISEALGKSTIDTKTHGQTKGRSGSYSTKETPSTPPPLHAGGRLLHPRSGAAGGKPPHWAVGPDAQGVSARTPARPVQCTASVGKTLDISC